MWTQCLLIAMTEKSRLDALLTARGLAESRSKAQALIMAGKVSVNGQIVIKAGTQISKKANITIKEISPYVSRGGTKLAAALDAFALSPQNAVCADVGASTGGFTDVLLQRGAIRVYAIDVGYGQLAWNLRQDNRVIVMERTNARYIDALPEPINLVTIDASFISLKLILPVVFGWLAIPGRVVALVKPQFEAGKSQVGKGGVVRDNMVHRQVLSEVTTFAGQLGFSVLGLVASPITGPAGNYEFLLYLGWQTGLPSINLNGAIEACIANIV